MRKIHWRNLRLPTPLFLGFLGGSDGRELPVMRETCIQSLDWEDPLDKGMASPLQYSGLKNSMDCIVHGVAKSQTWLSNFHFTNLLGKVLPQGLCTFYFLPTTLSSKRFTWLYPFPQLSLFAVLLSQWGLLWLFCLNLHICIHTHTFLIPPFTLFSLKVSVSCSVVPNPWQPHGL